MPVFPKDRERERGDALAPVVDMLIHLKAKRRMASTRIEVYGLPPVLRLLSFHPLQPWKECLEE